MVNYDKRFSIAHFDRFHGEYASAFYTMMKNADPSYIKNIHDVYFGKYFYYEYEFVNEGYQTFASIVNETELEELLEEE